MSQEIEVVEGVVERIKFHNAANGYSVFSVRAGDDPITVVGTYPFATAGEYVQAQGVFVTHATYGRQLRAESIESRLPTDPDDIKLFLRSGAVRGVGEVLAGRIVDKFGADSLKIIADEPLRLLEVKGITKNKADEICDSMKIRTELADLSYELISLSVPPAIVTRLFTQYGSAAPDAVRENPYLLCEDGLFMPFGEADAIAAGLGFTRHSPVRVAAGIKFVLRHNLQNGHMFLPRGKLTKVAAAMLGAQPDDVDDYVEDLLMDGELMISQVGSADACFFPAMRETEISIAQRLLELDGGATSPPVNLDSLIARVEQQTGMTYAAMQREAISAALRHGVMVLTGGPGTGKTTTLMAIIEAFSACGLTISLCAPTGRAAKRMTELCGIEAKTIHRLLEADFRDQEHPVFLKDEDDPLDCDAVIVDEMSMVDAPLMAALLRAVRPEGRVVLVGDSDQLPPVGPGNVLRDIIDSGRVKVIRLTEIFRQAMGSLIVTNAHAINSGEYPDLSHTDRDFFFLGRKNQLVPECIVELCRARLPGSMGLDPFTDLQVITPQKKGPTGTENLNRLLQQALNPPAESKRERAFGGIVIREGDKVMQVRNNYDLIWIRGTGEMGFGVFNGDVGRVEYIDPKTETCRVMFDDRQVDYTYLDMFDLDHAYAITVHKSQGSEFKAVVMPACPGPAPLMCRNVLYTAVTRARELVVAVGDVRVMHAMIDNNRKLKRYTSLKHILREGGEEQWP